MFYKIGHRGACGYAKENTLSSFQKALSLNVDMIELDVHLCRSGEVVVIHEDTIKTKKRKELIKKTNYTDLNRLDIPTLEDVLSLIKGQTRVNIELKGSGTARPVSGIVKKYLKKGYFKKEDFLISSFNIKELKKSHLHLPEIKKGFLIGPFGPCSFWINKLPLIFKYYLKRARKLRASSLHIHKNLINHKIIRLAQKENLKVFAYTVNEFREINRLKKIGADGIFSDYPDRL
ncbi:MAG: glycerophosphodiester phosphodiesterase [Candidatus Moraniibacteriota bacterium]